MISGFVASLVLSVIRTMGYGGLFTLSFLENMAVPLPSEVVVPFSGFLASTGRFNLLVVIFVATLGNWLGSVLLFYLVREHGRLIILKYGHYVLLREHDFQRVEGWFRRYGPATVFWLRLVPLGRVLITIPAAIGNMNQRAFSFFTLLAFTQN